MSVEQRKATILAAAGERFSAASYSEVSTQDIATASETSQALIFHYFGSKSGLYTAWMNENLQSLSDSVHQGLATVPPNTSRRDRVRLSLEHYLDFIEEHPLTWSIVQRGGDEPIEATNLRIEFRDEFHQELRELLDPQGVRGDYAIAGFIGFLISACMEWADSGFNADERAPLIEALLGSLQGALGDWGG